MNTITIYDKTGNPRDDFKSISIGVGSIRRYTLMKEDYILLRFTLDENIPLRIGDYVDLREYLGEGDLKPEDYQDHFTRWFVIDRDYFPSYDKNTGGWKYDLQVNAFYYMWSNKIFVYEGKRTNPEAGVTLTDPITRHAEMIAANLESAGFRYLNEEDETFICVHEDSLINKGVKTISYNAISILDAIKEIANVFECEWWVDYRTIHFGYRRGESKDKVELALNDQIDSASTSKASGVYATRLYAFGGETNIPAHYRDELEFTVDKVNGNSVYDTKKPVFSSLFRSDSLKDAESQTHSVTGSVTYNAYPHVIKDNVFNLAYSGSSGGEYRQYFEGQYYKFKLTDFDPCVSISKIVVHGSNTAEFGLTFRWGLRLVGSDGTVQDIIDPVNDATFSGAVSSLGARFKEISIVDERLGYIGVGGTFRRGGGGGNNRTETFEKASNILASVKIGSRKDVQSAFWVGDNPYLERNDTHFSSALTPISWHTEGAEYTLFATGLGDKHLGITHGELSSDGHVLQAMDESYIHLRPKVSDIEETIKIPKAGWYKVQFYVTLVGWSNVVSYDGNPCISFGSNVTGFNITRQIVAKAVETKLQRKVDDKWDDEELQVTINPQFRDGEIKDKGIVEGYHEDSFEIRFKGENPLKIGDAFRLPYIMRSRVPDAYFVQYSTGNLSVEVGDRNLMLPEGTEHVDAEGVTDDNAVEAIVVYDWIYPSTRLKVIEYNPTYKEDGEEAKTTTKRVRLDIPNFDKQMQVEDKTLYMIPQDGFGAGYRFEIIPTDNKDSQGSWFIVKENTDYSVTIPNEYIYPEEGKEVILDGINVEFFDDGRAVEKAENALLEQAEKDIAELSKPNVVVDVTLRPQYSFEHGRFPLGQLVNIKGVLERDFDSRIIGFEEKLDYYYDHPKYFVGDTNYYSVLGNIDTKLTEVEKESAAMAGQYGKGGVKIITSTDDYIRPSEATVFSSARVENRFLHTDKDDEAEGTITFKKDIIVEGDTDINTLKVKGDEEVFGNSTIYSNSTIKGTQTNEQDVRAKKDVQVDGVVRVSKADDEDDDSIGMLVGNFFEQGDIVQGAKITKSGIASFAAIKTPSLQVYELVYNRKTAVHGEFIFSDGDTVEDVRYIDLDGKEHTPQEIDFEEYSPYQKNEDGSYKLDSDGRKEPNYKCVKLMLKTPYNGYMTTFTDFDILYANINNIGDSGEGAKTGKCFMRVLSDDELNELNVSVNSDENALYVTLYDDIDVPSGVNMLPAPWMDITRHGNEKDTDRQDVFIISSEEGRLAQLVGVNSPKIDAETSYGLSLGILPDNILEKLKDNPQVNPNHPYLYSRGAVIQDLIRLDYQGKIIKTERYRGTWSKNIAEGTIEGEDKYRNTATSYDTVTHKGSLWQCNRDETTEEPKEGSNAWLLLVAKGDDGTSIRVSGSYDNVVDFEAEWVGSNGWIAPDDPSACFIVGTDLYVWDTKEWKNVGQFKGDKGDKGDTGEAGKDGKDGMSPQENLLDNTSQFDANWELSASSSNKVTIIEGLDGHKALSRSGRTSAVFASHDITNKVVGDEWYTLSFISKGSGFIDIADTGIIYSNLDDGVYIYVDGEQTVVGSGRDRIKMTSDWAKHTFTFKTPIPNGMPASAILSLSASSSCQLCQPKLERGQQASAWMESASDRKGEAGDTYYLLVSPDTIYVNKKNEMSSNEIAVSVVETTPYGVTSIRSNERLDELGLSVQYQIAGKERVLFNIEDKFDASPDYTTVDFFLVYNSEDISTKVVSFPHEGQDGETPITLHSSPSTVNILRSAQGNEYLGEKKHTIEVYAKDSYDIVDSNKYTISVEKGNIYTCTTSDKDGKHYVTITFGDKVEVTPSPIKVTFLDGETTMGVLEVPIVVAERGLVGEAGSAGAMLMPYGNYQNNVFYKLVMKGDEVFGKPTVYHIANGAEEGNQFVLEKSMDENSFVESDGVRYPTDSNGKIIDLSNTEYWTIIEKTKYIYTDAIMANYAHFGSDKGAVFYDRYLFSQYGIDKNGNFDSYTNHVDTMWDDNGGLSGAFTPSLFIDMYAGTTKADKFAETLQEYRYSDADGDLFANEIRFNETYNVKYEPLISWEGNNDNLSSSPRLLAMPLANNITNGNGEILVEAQHDAELDGIKSNIIARANRGWSRKKEGTFKTITGVTPFKDIAQLSSCSLILCADPRLLNPYAWRKQGDSVFNPSLLVDDGWSVPQEIGRFVIDSKLTDFILLEAGKQIRLRSCKSGDVLYWYVENSEDFKEVPYEVYYQTDTMYDVDKDSIVKGDFSHQIGYRNEGEVNEYYRRTFASTSIAKYYDERVKNGVAMSVTINASSNAGEDDWNWEQDITNIEIKSV